MRLPWDSATSTPSPGIEHGRRDSFPGPGSVPERNRRKNTRKNRDESLDETTFENIADLVTINQVKVLLITEVVSVYNACVLSFESSHINEFYFKAARKICGRGG